MDWTSHSFLEPSLLSCIIPLLSLVLSPSTVITACHRLLTHFVPLRQTLLTACSLPLKPRFHSSSPTSHSNSCLIGYQLPPDCQTQTTVSQAPSSSTSLQCLILTFFPLYFVHDVFSSDSPLLVGVSHHLHRPISSPPIFVGQHSSVLLPFPFSHP